MFTPNDFGIELISISNFGKNRFSNPRLRLKSSPN